MHKFVSDVNLNPYFLKPAIISQHLLTFTWVSNCVQMGSPLWAGNLLSQCWSTASLSSQGLEYAARQFFSPTLRLSPEQEERWPDWDGQEPTPQNQLPRTNSLEVTLPLATRAGDTNKRDPEVLSLQRLQFSYIL